MVDVREVRVGNVKGRGKAGEKKEEIDRWE